MDRWTARQGSRTPGRKSSPTVSTAALGALRGFPKCAVAAAVMNLTTALRLLGYLGPQPPSESELAEARHRLCRDLFIPDSIARSDEALLARLRPVLLRGDLETGTPAGCHTFLVAGAVFRPGRLDGVEVEVFQLNLRGDLL